MHQILTDQSNPWIKEDSKGEQHHAVSFAVSTGNIKVSLNPMLPNTLFFIARDRRAAWELVQKLYESAKALEIHLNATS